MLENLPQTWDEWPFSRGESPTLFYTEVDLALIIQVAGGLPDTPIRHGILCARNGIPTWLIKNDAPLVERRQELRFQLELSARHFRSFEAAEAALRGQRASLDLLSKLAKQCSKLREDMKRPVTSMVYGPIRQPNLAALDALLEQASAWFEQSAGGTEPYAEPKGHGGERRHSCAINSLIKQLGMIYRHVLENEPYRGNKDGPFTRYLEACLRPLKGKCTPHRAALQQRWLRLSGRKQ